MTSQQVWARQHVVFRHAFSEAVFKRVGRDVFVECLQEAHAVVARLTISQGTFNELHLSRHINALLPPRETTI